MVIVSAVTRVTRQSSFSMTISALLSAYALAVQCMGRPIVTPHSDNLCTLRPTRITNGTIPYFTTSLLRRSAVVVGCLAFLITSTTNTEAANKKVKALEDAVSVVDTIETLEALHILSTLNQVSAESMRKSWNRRRVMDELAKFRISAPVFLVELEARLKICRNYQYDIRNDDIRIKMVLENGPWTSEWVEPLDCNGDTCLTWIYTYAPTDSHPKGRTIVCEGEPGADWPTVMSSSSATEARLAGPIYPFVMPALLPNWGTDVHEVSIGVTIPADQLSRPTLDRGVLSIRVDVFNRTDQERENLVASDEITTNLEPLRAILAKSQTWQWRALGAQGYLMVTLASGEYHVALSVIGARNNEGKVEIDFTIPKSPVLSDLLLIREVRGAGLDEGIKRGDESFYSVSRPEFLPKTVITLRLEFLLPATYGGQYHAWASLTPIARNGAKKLPGTVDAMPVVYWEDEDGVPKYGSSLPIELRTPTITDQSNMTLLDQTYDVTTTVMIFQEQVTLPSKAGQYVLSLQISESAKREWPLGTKSVVISILPR